MCRFRALVPLAPARPYSARARMSAPKSALVTRGRVPGRTYWRVWRVSRHPVRAPAPHGCLCLVGQVRWHTHPRQLLLTRLRADADHHYCLPSSRALARAPSRPRRPPTLSPRLLPHPWSRLYSLAPMFPAYTSAITLAPTRTSAPAIRPRSCVRARAGLHPTRPSPRALVRGAPVGNFRRERSLRVRTSRPSRPCCCSRALGARPIEARARCAARPVRVCARLLGESRALAILHVRPRHRKYTALTASTLSPHTRAHDYSPPGTPAHRPTCSRTCMPACSAVHFPPCTPTTLLALLWRSGRNFPTGAVTGCHNIETPPLPTEISDRSAGLLPSCKVLCCQVDIRCVSP
jgi:hypothetical protein